MAEGLDVRLSTIVTSVTHDEAGVRITTADGGSFEADRVIGLADEGRVAIE